MQGKVEAGRELPPHQRGRIARPGTALWQAPLQDKVWDVVVVGSGYGGAAAAATLAGLQVTGADGKPRKLELCVLERGNEYLPGEFASHFADLPRQVRLTRQMMGHVANPEGLMDLRLGDDVAALVGNGLGGGSLINAGVMLQPNAEEMAAGASQQLVRDLKQGPWYERALNALGARVQDSNKALIDNTLHRHGSSTSGVPSLGTFKALDHLAKGAGEHRAVPITVAMRTETNAAGTLLNACTLCGDCFTGCNVGAKNSLDASLLAQAAMAGAELFTGISVLTVRKAKSNEVGGGARWVLRAGHTDSRLQKREPGLLYIKARLVVLAAGTLGSTEILLRSQSDLLPLSKVLGQGFSCNGDSIAAINDLPVPAVAINGVADEDTAANPPTGTTGRNVGPTIVSSWRLPIPPRTNADITRHFEVQGFAVPGPMARIYKEIVTTALALHEAPEADCSQHGNETGLDPLAVNHFGLQQSSLLVGLIGHDEAKGVLHWSGPREDATGYQQQGTLQIRWPDARHGFELHATHQALEAAHARVLAGENGKTQAKPPDSHRSRVLPNPMWRLLPEKLELLINQPKGPVYTVHPLGGCQVGRNANEGVVNAFGQVFDGSDPTGHEQPHKGLYVWDGAAIGQSLGVNPALTITAFALRAADKLAQELAAPPAPSKPLSPIGEHPAKANDRSGIAREQIDLPAPAPKLPTKVQLIERLNGCVKLDVGGTLPKPFIVELTLAYEDVEVANLMGPMHRRMQVLSDAQLANDPVHLGEDQKPFQGSRLRLFDHAQWHELDLRVMPEAQRNSYALLEARVSGQLQILSREPSCWGQRLARALPVWFVNRGARDIYQSFAKILSNGRQGSEKLQPNGQPKGKAGLLAMVKDVLRAASRAGEVRRLDYRLKIEAVLFNKLEVSRFQPLDFLANHEGHIIGDKRMTYSRRANPWYQSTQVQLREFPRMARQHGSVLKLDTRFLAGNQLPLVRFTQQHNQVEALADVASFGLYLARLLIHGQLWTFRKSDNFPDGSYQGPAAQIPQRLPLRITGLPEPQITELVVDEVRETKAPVHIRLTRYPRIPSGVGADGQAKAPLVMIHGYSVSGNTFTHPTLKPSAAEYFWRKGRDVWVLDMRTSTGLPGSTQPWSMETVGTVDIPAALLHVQRATGQRVDVLAHCIGCVMLSMAILADPQAVRDGGAQMGADDWLTTEQLGRLEAFNGSKAGLPHPTIGRIVLSQKGPFLRYADDNLIRIYVMQTLRRWLISDSYQFRPPENPGLADQLLDRLLATLPYPDADYDKANPFWAFWKRTPWTATRRRMDALYSRDFNAENMADSTLCAIDDLFGAIHPDTVAQTMHFARWESATSQRGRGEYVTQRQLQARWRGVATLAIHGRENGLVDVSTQSLLRERLREAGVPFAEKTHEGFGHQDCLIGKNSQLVFQDIEDFLEGPEPARVAQPAEQDFSKMFEVPWVGPRFDLPSVDELQTNEHPLSLMVMSRPDQGQATVVMLPAKRKAGPASGNTGPGFELLTLPADMAIGDSPENTGPLPAGGNWLRVTPDQNWPTAQQQAAGIQGWLVLLHYEEGQTTGHAPPEVAGIQASDQLPTPPNLPPAAQGDIQPGLPAGSHAMAKTSVESIRIEQAKRWMQSLHDAHPLEFAFVSAADLARARALINQASQESPPQGPPAEAKCIEFAVGSCQYPAGLMDKDQSSASAQCLARQLRQTQFVLLLGDQIYADGTAGLADATRKDERYEAPNEKALRAPGWRSVLRRVPVATLPDDHEISDNWEPIWHKGDNQRDEDRKLPWRVQRQNGMYAFWNYQRMRPKGGQELRDTAANLELNWGGVPVLMLDSRSLRGLRNTQGKAGYLLDASSLTGLKTWLTNKRDELKFVCTPSLLLPRSVQSTQGEAAHLHSDSWDGYPHQLHEVLDFMLDMQIKNTVFLSGDEHRSMLTEIRLSKLGQNPSNLNPIKAVSIHSSALYAPFPFANGRSFDLTDAPFNTPKGTHVHTASTHLDGDGFALIRIYKDPLGDEVCVRFVKTGSDEKSPSLRLNL